MWGRPEDILDPRVLENTCSRIFYPQADFELWHFEYQVARPLKNISDKFLCIRYKSILFNFGFLADSIRDHAPLDKSFRSSLWWLKKLYQTSLEFKWRDQSLPPSSPEIEYIYTSYKTIPHKTGSAHPGYIVRYGERWWLERFLKEGDMRVTPSPAYSMMKGDKARHDNENIKSQYLRGDKTKITNMDGTYIPPIGDVQKSTEITTGFYNVSFSTEFDTRLLNAFVGRENANQKAALVIWDIPEFLRRVESWSVQNIPDFYCIANEIQYYDPYEYYNIKKLPAALRKEFSFAYQREYRLLWDPVCFKIKNSSFHAFINPIDDIATLFSEHLEYLGGLR